MSVEKLKEHLMSEGKTDSWLELANQFKILPNESNKKKSDKVRRIFSTISDKDKKWLNPTINLPDFKLLHAETKFYAPTLERYVPDIGDWDKEIDLQDTTIKNQAEWEEFKKWKLGKNLKSIRNSPEPFLTGNINNVLIVGDIHLPFTVDGYLEFCREQQERFNCGKVVFIGDLVDNHAQSFHNTDPDGLSAKDELNLAIKKLQDWYYTFPNATCILGNHDRIIARKLFSTGLSQRWLRPLEEVLNVPNWKFVESITYNNILYVHGEGGTAIKKAQQEMTSIVQGHLHTEGYIQLLNGGKNFAMQVGTGIDFNSYAFAYAQRGKKPILSCGVVLGNHAILIPYAN